MASDAINIEVFELPDEQVVTESTVLLVYMCTTLDPFVIQLARSSPKLART